METTASKTDTLLLALILVGLGFLAGWSCGEDHYPTSPPQPPMRSSVVSSVRTHADSASLDIETKIPAVEVKARANCTSEPLLDTLNTKDSVAHTISCLDTILKSADTTRRADTLEVCHIMPQDSFALFIRFAPRDTIATIRYEVHDSLIERNDTVTIAEASKKEWYETPLEMIGALFAGFLLGTLRK
jgi:hypothetical protein